MGWTGTHASNYKIKNGRSVVDVKAECDDLFADHGRFKVLKSSMVGSTYYAAIAICKIWPEGVPKTPENLVDVPESEREVFGEVILTSVDHNDYFNFNYKDMSESCGPYKYDCPMGIIKLLTPTESEWANQWREKCREKAAKKNAPQSLSKLPIGTKIKINTPDGEVTLIKRSPAYQFKTPWWYDASAHRYVSKKRIKDYTIVE